jgi:hypothetical protein
MHNDSVEQVAIEMVHVGDFVFSAPPAHAAVARCVIAKRATSDARAERIVGWLVELSDGEVAWWPRGAAVWRRRLWLAVVERARPGSPAAEPLARGALAAARSPVAVVVAARQARRNRA